MEPTHTIKIGSRTYGVWVLRYGAVIVRCLSASYQLQEAHP
jgi:hypothetical protein